MLPFALRWLRVSNLGSEGDRFAGPFNAPDRQVAISFSADVAPKQARVCHNSAFHKKPMTVLLQKSMISIDEAKPSLHCQPRQGDMETIEINHADGRVLLNIADGESLPEAAIAIARELPGYAIASTTNPEWTS